MVYLIEKLIFKEKHERKENYEFLLLGLKRKTHLPTFITSPPPQKALIISIRTYLTFIY